MVLDEKKLLVYYGVTSATLRITYLLSFLSVPMGMSGHTMGSNPTLSARSHEKHNKINRSLKVSYKWSYKPHRSELTPT